MDDKNTLVVDVDRRTLRGTGLEALSSLKEHLNGLAQKEEERRNALRTAQDDPALVSLSAEQRAAVDRLIALRESMSALHGERRGVQRAIPSVNALQQALTREYTRNSDLGRTNRSLSDRLGKIEGRVKRGESWKR